MTRTEDFLREAFAGESGANRKYSIFAAQADKEGYAQAARLFRAAAEAEAVHAANHLRALKAIKTTKENLREAIAGETHEFKDMYPEMIAIAKEEAPGMLRGRLTMPMRWKSIMPGYIMICSRGWISRRSHSPITSARYAA